MFTTLRVLILEDNSSDARLMAAQLHQEGFELDWQRVESEADFVDHLKPGLDLILSDFTLPQFDGVRALQHLRERKLDIPFIFVSGTIDEEIGVQAMREGAADYLLKDRLARLGQAVRRALEQKALRDRNRQTEDRLRLQASALAAAANGILITDHDGGILWANAALLAMTGCSLRELEGQATPPFRSGKQDPKFCADLWATIRSGRVWTGELTNQRKDGTVYQEEMTITPVQDDQGQITHFIAIKQDITQRKQLQAQFLQAQKMEVVGQLAGGVAHDFNNLLTVICGFGEMLRASLPKDGQGHDLIAQIIKAGERAAGLTQQLLAFSRKQVLQPRVLDLNAEIEEATRMLGRLLGENVELETIPGTDLHPVKADPGQVQQVLMNLAVNARDAMIRGGKLTVATRNVDVDEAFIARHPSAHQGPHVLLEVRDTGCGMPPEVLGRIFEPFFTTKGPGQGSGLGLATVYGIVEQSGGHIDVESQPGCGSVFRIYLPRTDASTGASLKPPSSPELHMGGECILLVEDDDGVRALAAMILLGAGYTVLEARDGEEGIAVFEKHSGPIHLLLTDVVMPRMDGCQLGKILKSRLPTLRVLYMSGYLHDAQVQHGIEDGLPFLHKPFHTEPFLHKVREVLDAPEAAVT